MAESTDCTDFLNLAKRLAEEIIVEIAGAVDYGLTKPKLAEKLGEKIGAQRLKSFKKYLAAAAKRRRNDEDAWNSFVKSVKCLVSEREKGPRSPWKVKLKNSDRKQEIRKSKEENILEDLSMYEYRMALLCESLKTALDSHEDGGGFDYQGSRGNTVLHILSALPLDTSHKQAFSEEVIELLVKNNIDHSIKNHKSLTALHILAGNYILDPRTNFDPSAISHGLQCTASTIGRYKVLNSFVLTNAFDVRGPHGNSILHEWVIQRAIRGNEDDERMNNDEERIGTWIMAVARVSPNKTNDYGCTPLHYAFTTQVFEFLCKEGAEKNRLNECGESPFMYFLKHCFLRGYVANAMSSESETLPPEREEDSQSDIPKRPEDQIHTTLSCCLGIKKNNDKNLENLIEFTSMPTLETLEKLVKAGLDFSEKDGQNDERDCLDYLLCILRECVCEGCKEKDGHKFKTFKSLLHCIKVLIENHSAILGGKKIGKRAPLYQVLVFYFDSLKMLHEEIRSLVVENVVKPMLDAEADPNTADRNKDTVLHFCCHKVNPKDKQQKNVVKLLCEYGASTEAENSNGDTPIKILKGRNNQECSKLAKSIATMKPRLWVNVDCKSVRYKDGLDKLCRAKCPKKEESIRYDPNHIGKGAMSFIFLAVDEKSKREVALKRILKASFEKELQNEIKSLVKLEENSHVVQYYRLVENSTFYFLALELMEGDLSYLVKEHQSLLLDEEMTLKLSADVVKGLSFLHHRNILHRDLKPGNILYRLEDHRKPCLKLADFGLAKHLTPSVNQSTVLGGSTSSSLTGTRGWMAPELVRREVHNHSKSTDMFALGLVIHFLISKGFHPFDQSGEPIFVAVSKGTLKPHELETGIDRGTFAHFWKGLTPEARHLMELLLCPEPSLRPPAEDLLKQHCYFWSKLKKVEFMKTVGDQKEIAQPSMLFLAVLNLEASPFGDHVRNNPWDNKIPHLWGEISLRRSYDTKTVVDLIRFFRNAYAHFQERSEKGKIQLLNDKFFAEFHDFFLTVWKVVRYDMGWMEAKSERYWLLRVVNELD